MQSSPCSEKGNALKRAQKMQWHQHQHRLEPGGEIIEGFPEEWYLNTVGTVCVLSEESYGGS